MATLSSIDCRVFSCSRFGTSASKSIMHLPIVARSPLSATASNTTSVSCTVSIVSTDVVPLHSSSVVASRAAARSDSGVCAASIGHTRDRSQSISAQIVGVTAEERLTQMHVRLDQAGQHVAAARLDDPIVTAGEVRPDRGDPAVDDRDVALDDVEPVVHRQNVPPRMRSEACRRPTYSAFGRYARAPHDCGRCPPQRGGMFLAVFHGDQLGEDADGDLLRRDRADVEADRGVDARERVRRHLSSADSAS